MEKGEGLGSPRTAAQTPPLTALLQTFAFPQPCVSSRHKPITQDGAPLIPPGGYIEEKREGEGTQLRCAPGTPIVMLAYCLLGL